MKNTDWNMIGDNELYGKEVFEKFFLYSQSYLNGAVLLCENMAEDVKEQTWPNATVVLYLSFHSLELFFKGAILKKYPNENVNSHKIENLKNRYRNLYPGEKYNTEFPFKTEYPNLEENIIKEMKKEPDVSPFDQAYRYPSGKDGIEWADKGAIYAFEANSYLKYLFRYREEISLIINKINKG